MKDTESYVEIQAKRFGSSKAGVTYSVRLAMPHDTDRAIRPELGRFVNLKDAMQYAQYLTTCLSTATNWAVVATGEIE